MTIDMAYEFGAYRELTSGESTYIFDYLCYVPLIKRVFRHAYPCSR